MLSESDRGHDGDDKSLDGLVNGHKHRTATVDAPYLDCERHSRRNETLKYEFMYIFELSKDA